MNIYFILHLYAIDKYLSLYHKMTKSGNIFNKVKRKFFCFVEYSIFTKSAQATN